MKTIPKISFITGGSGYIGRNLIQHLRAEGHAIFALARSDRAARIVSGLGAKVIKGDLFDSAALKQGMDNANYLFHLAADTNHGRSTKKQMEANRRGTELVYRTAQGCHITRAIHLSTEAVLLTGKPLINADETTPLPDHFPGTYSASKAAAEQIALAYGAKGLDIVVVRPRFVWGRDDTTALPQLVAAAQSGKLKWIDTGHYPTSTTHIANLCHGLLLALNKGCKGEIYFITDGPPISFRKFITALLETQGVTAPKGEVPRSALKLVVQAGEFLSTITGGLLQGPMSMQEYATLGVEVTLNIKKAEQDLGYSPLLTREQGLEELRALSGSRS